MSVCDVTKIISLLCNKKLILCQYPATPEDFGLGIYRPVFLDALMPMLDSHNVHFNRHCVSLSILPSGAHLLHFADGSTHGADVIIGADGIKSVIREFVTGPRESQVAYSNSVAYRAVIPVETLQKAGVKTDLLRSLCWVGKDQREKINVVFFFADSSVPVGSVDVPLPWAHPVSQEEVLREYSGWGDDANIMIKEMNNTLKWHLHFVRPLSRFVRDRVVVVGDAVTLWLSLKLCPSMRCYLTSVLAWAKALKTSTSFVVYLVILDLERVISRQVLFNDHETSLSDDVLKGCLSSLR
ncbi:hypothetical protein H0H92_002890 [Tricholoma furcatifolium]|nr:hypothetical protein H0H92_002890 [Tricholoma furcatifolium]